MFKLSIRKVREALPARREPFWALVEPGRYLGVRVTEEGRYWVARGRKGGAEGMGGSAAYQQERLGAETAAFDYPEASKAARSFFAKLDAGVVSRGKFTVESAAREYIEDRRREKGDKTADDAQWRFNRTVNGTAFGRTEVEKLRTPDIKAWRDALTEEDDEGRQMGKAGANRMLRTLRAALNMAVKHKRVAATAMQEWRDVEQYKKADGRRTLFLDRGQRTALLEAADPSTRELLEAALLLGARPGELVSAKRSAFDGRTGTLTLVGKVGRRDIPLSAAALALFARLSKSKLPEAPLLTRDGHPWTRIEWSRRIRVAAEAASLPEGVTLYVMRHCYITEALQAGLTTADVAHLTGTSLAMLQAHYSQFVQSAVRERIDRVQMI